MTDTQLIMVKCTKCMMDLEPGVRICPHCGYDQQGEAQPEHALKRNTILYGRYLVGNVIGQGGFGITYVGYDLKLETKVAIKEYYPAAAASRTGSLSARIRWDYGNADEHTKGIERFVKEARKMAALDAVPSIVRVWDVFEDNDTAYIVMDFVEGVTLKQYLLKHGVMSWEACRSLLFPILESLAVIHERGFIHRDISPDNIMVQNDGTARLLDMGAAVGVRATQGQASMPVVKRNFSAPEQYTETEELGSWTDVYSMAATMYYCLTGRVVPEPMERTYSQKPIIFPENCSIPGEVKNALLGAMELSRDTRLRDMRMFRNRLTGGSGGSGGGSGKNPAGGSDVSHATDSSGESIPAFGPESGAVDSQTDQTGNGEGKKTIRIREIRGVMLLVSIALIILFFTPTMRHIYYSDYSERWRSYNVMVTAAGSGYIFCLFIPIVMLVAVLLKKIKKTLKGGIMLACALFDLFLWVIASSSYHYYATGFFVLTIFLLLFQAVLAILFLLDVPGRRKTAENKTQKSQ
ncbi:MAG: serine/threonine protein kinase [Clostridiales bacterium]|nr:serine/threonine protein kinase [Clostridiales bacterium]